MNPIQLFGILEELLHAYSELKADGTLDKIIAAEQAVAHEFANNEKVKHLTVTLGKLLGHPEPAPPAPTLTRIK